jgi:hypothetical protein
VIRQGSHIFYSSGAQHGLRVTPKVRKNILHRSKAEHMNRLNLEPALILAFTKIRLRIELLAYQKQTQSSHSLVRTTLIIDKIFSHLILLCKSIVVLLLISV